MMAAYFAVEDDSYEANSAIYVYKAVEGIDISDFANPFEIGSVKKFFPKHITRRLIAQSGLFTIHPNPKVPITLSEKIDRLIIIKALRSNLKNILYRYGIHQASVYPDLDGLAGHLKWLRGK